MNGGTLLLLMSLAFLAVYGLLRKVESNNEHINKLGGE